MALNEILLLGSYVLAAALIAVGAYMIFPPAGFIVAGLGVAVIATLSFVEVKGGSSDPKGR